ncbi:MAG: aminotransferase class IV, partial [Ferruginibacter sp.]
MRYINFNGKIMPSGAAIVSSDNRALRYGDGLFETIKFYNNQLVLINEHMARLWKGMQDMKMKIPKHFQPEKIEELVISLLKKNNYQYARVRISVARGNGGLYDSDNNFHYIIECWPLTTDYKILNENGLELCIYKEALKICDHFSNLKHNNFLPYFMGALFAQQNKCNDALILNHHLRVCDSSNANIFIIINDTIITPPLSEGCIAGTIRKLVIQLLPEL